MKRSKNMCNSTALLNENRGGEAGASRRKRDHARSAYFSGNTRQEEICDRDFSSLRQIPNDVVEQADLRQLLEDLFAARALERLHDLIHDELGEQPPRPAQLFAIGF